MAITFKFFHDSALTQEITALNPLTALQDTAGGIGPVNKIIYLGSTASGVKAQATSSPGTDPIVVSIADSAPASGSPASEIRLALTAGGLDTATPGASLTLSTSILSGAANAIPIYTRRVSAIAVAGAYTDLSIKTNSLTETPV